MSTKCVEWKLKNFLDLPIVIDYYIESPRFSLHGTKWHLSVHPNGDEENVGWIRVNVHKDSTLEGSVVCRVGIKDSNCFEIKVLENTFSFLTEYRIMCFYLVKRSTVQSSKLVYLSPEGTLTVFCCVRMQDQRSLSSDMETASQRLLLDGDSTLFNDFKNMYNSGKYTDVTILVKNEKFCAHRNVLASRSAVFASMFQHDLTEKSSGKVEISDCDPDSFEEFLLFLYTGKLNNVSSGKAVHLYKTADKYDVKQLKEKCVDIMRHNLCVDSFCSVMHLATMHCEPDLFKVATDFFIENVEAILQTSKWIQFSEENLILSNELFMKFVQSTK